MLRAEMIEEGIVGKQRVPAIGNQDCGRDLLGIGIQLATLMAEQRVDWRNANLQQCE